MKTKQNHVKNRKLFGIDQPQPSPKAKKLGWERRREAQKLMDLVSKYFELSLKEILTINENMKLHPEKYTLRERKMFEYITEKKYTLDLIDRHIPKAPQKIDLENSGQINIKVISNVRDKPKPSDS